MIDKQNKEITVCMGTALVPDRNGNQVYEANIHVGDNFWFAGRGSSLAVALGVAADFWRINESPETAKDQDWGDHELKLAERILVQLGIGYEASKEPGADGVRDCICAIIAESSRPEPAEHKSGPPDLDLNWRQLSPTRNELRTAFGTYTIVQDAPCVGGTCYVWVPEKDDEYHVHCPNMATARELVRLDVEHSLNASKQGTLSR